MLRNLPVFVVICFSSMALHADTLTFRRINVSAFLGPLMHASPPAVLSGSAGLRVQSDLSDLFFVSLQHQLFLQTKSNSEEILFSTAPFTPARTVKYSQTNSYTQSGINFGYYFYGWGDDASNAYLQTGFNFMSAKYEMDAEDFDRSAYESFPEDGKKNISLLAWSIGIGHNTLLGKHFGIFQELQVNLGLNGNKNNQMFQEYQEPQGHYFSLMFGFRYFIFSQESILP